MVHDVIGAAAAGLAHAKQIPATLNIARIVKNLLFISSPFSSTDYIAGKKLFNNDSHISDYSTNILSSQGATFSDRTETIPEVSAGSSSGARI